MLLDDNRLYALTRRKDRPVLIFGVCKIKNLYHLDLNTRGDRSVVIAFPLIEETDTFISFKDPEGPNILSVLTEEMFKKMQPYEFALQVRTWDDLKRNGIAGNFVL